jgi:SAM-dependent methyltransferase
MGYVFEFIDAASYERWLSIPKNRFALDLECRMMNTLLNPVPRETILNIGCGTGSVLIFLINQGLHATGIDPSPYMLDIARKTVGNRADLHRGFAEDLPFEDNSFNYACFFTTLEFVNDPQKALEEAFRVAKNKVFIGALNRYAITGIERRVKGIFSRSIYNHARFFTIWGLKKNIYDIAGKIPISWRTVCQFRIPNGRLVHHLEEYPLLHHCPFGAFIGMTATLVPKFGTQLLPIDLRAKQTPSAIPG